MIIKCMACNNEFTTVVWPFQGLGASVSKPEDKVPMYGQGLGAWLPKCRSEGCINTPAPFSRWCQDCMERATPRFFGIDPQTYQKWANKTCACVELFTSTDTSGCTLHGEKK